MGYAHSVPGGGAGLSLAADGRPRDFMNGGSLMLEKALAELEKYYDECCRGMSMEYLYGYFDAVAIVRELAEKS